MENVELVVLFCDISNFMRLSAALKERAPEFMQSFYESAGDCIVRRGGSIIKYIGDAILCVFPRGAEEDALRCAIDMRSGLTSLLRRYSVDEGAQLEAAIDSGSVTRGRFGHRSLLTDDVMGETVARASVLNRHRGIVVSRAVRDALPRSFRTEELPPLPMKWRSDSLEAWRVLPVQSP